MTTPDGGLSNFDYTDDSVIARVSFDIPASAVTDISQITQVMGAMRTQLEAVARAQEDWLGYLQSVPQIAERANQAFRDQITLMERMTYLQSEIKQSGGGGNYGYGAAAGAAGAGEQAGGGGAAQYSTAAPSGYTPHWQTSEPGMGTGTNINAAMAAMAKIGQDDRAIGEMAAGRGIAINPAVLGGVAGAVAGAFGQDSGGQQGRGTEDPGATNAQPTQSGRRAASPPNPAKGGVPQDSDDQNQPNDAEGGTTMQKLLARLRKEITAGSAGRLGDLTQKIPGKYRKGVNVLLDQLGNMVGGGGGDDSSNPGGGSPGGFGTMALNAARSMIPKTTAGKIGLGIGAGATAFKLSQDMGERITRLQELGSQEGGDWTTGLKEDFNARFQALDPFINLDQARKAIAMPMMAGFQGDSRDQLRDELINNFKELGVSFADSMKMAVTDLRGVELTDENVKKSRTSREGAMNVLKEMAGDGGNTMALEERTQQMEQMKAILNSLGVNQESAERSAIATQAGFDDSMALRGEGARITGQTASSKTLMSVVGIKHGLGGILPEAMPAALADMGIDTDEARDEAAAWVAQQVSGLQPEYNRIAAFMRLMGEQGVELDYPQAKDLYHKVSGSKDKMPSQVGNKRAAELSQKNKQTNWNPITGIKDTVMPLIQGLNPFSDEKLSDVPGDMLDGFLGYHKPSQNADRVNQSFVDAGRVPGQFAPAGKRPQPLPQSLKEATPTSITTQGQVTGEVRLVVDQQGRVSAPPVISLTGTQRAVNAGVGSSTLNNAPPGEGYSFKSFSGG